MQSTKKGNNWHFGIKAHTKTDLDSGVVHTFVARPTNVNDSEIFKQLITTGENYVMGDRAYDKASKYKLNVGSSVS